jgi:hypothetical protein
MHVHIRLPAPEEWQQAAGCASAAHATGRLWRCQHSQAACMPGRPGTARPCSPPVDLHHMAVEPPRAEAAKLEVGRQHRGGGLQEGRGVCVRLGELGHPRRVGHGRLQPRQRLCFASLWGKEESSELLAVGTWLPVFVACHGALGSWLHEFVGIKEMAHRKLSSDMPQPLSCTMLRTPCAL